MNILFDDKKKVVLIDYNIYVFKAIFTWVKNRQLYAPYNCLKMILGDLKKVGINSDDIIIVAKDGRNSWRKDIDSNYKANRKAARLKHIQINWDEQFAKFDRLFENIEIATPFHTIEIDRLESDDIISYGTRYEPFKNYDSIIISTDSDFDQLVRFDNVKIFSPKTKKYKIVKNPYQSLAKKIEKEVSDNLVTPILNKKDYEKRNMIVNLTTLPQPIENKIKEKLDQLEYGKYFELNKLQFKKIQDTFMSIYDTEKPVTMADSFKKKKKKETKKNKQQQLTL